MQNDPKLAELMASPREQVLLEKFLALPEVSFQSPPALRTFRGFADRFSRVKGGPRFLKVGESILVKTRKAGSGVYGICSDGTGVFFGRRFVYIVCMCWPEVLPSKGFYIMVFTGVSTTENSKVETNGYFISMPLLDGRSFKDPFSRVSIYCWILSPESQPIYLTDEFFLKKAEVQSASKDKKSKVIVTSNAKRPHHKDKKPIACASDSKVEETSEQAFFRPSPVQAQTSPKSRKEETSASSGVISGESSPQPVQSEENVVSSFQLPQVSPVQNDVTGEMGWSEAGEFGFFLMDGFAQEDGVCDFYQGTFDGCYPDFGLGC